MAEVFKAKSFGVEGFEKIVAIKRILPSLAEDGDFIEMFIDEAKICGQLNHANICQIFELGQVEDSHFIGMEYVWGKDLLQIQNRFRKQRQMMTPEMAAFIGCKLCEGLDYAHKKKDASGKLLSIIHRDVSPQNVLISYDGELKIIDFGIAKAASRSSKTQAGVLKGKFGYMSPEQVRGLPLDHRSDVFAIGTIMYELLTAGRLFVGESDFETLEKVRNAEVLPPSKVNPLVGESMEKIVLKALARDVEDRYQWASEMQEALHGFLLASDPVFTAKHLSTWMREQFAVEMKREEHVLDEQRKVSREVLLEHPSLEPPSTRRPTPQAMRSASLIAPEPAPSFSSNPAEDFADDQTTVSPSTFSPLTFSDDTPSGVSSKDLATVVKDQNTVLKDQKAVLKDQKAVLKGPKAVQTDQNTVIRGSPTAAPDQNTMIRSEADIARSLLPQSTVILDGSGARPLPQRNLVSELPPPVAIDRGGFTGALTGPPSDSSRGTLWKDIFIGVGVAALGIAGLLSWQSHLRSEGQRSTLVVMNPLGAADVSVDGQPRGHLEPGTALTLREIEPGHHEVQARTADGHQFKQMVIILPGDVSVISATSKSPQGDETGHLKLAISTPNSQVYVDGAQLPDDATKQPIALKADVPHEVRVTKAHREEVLLSVTLKPGQELSRSVDLVPQKGRLRIETEPSFAEVVVNGRRAGQSPITLKDLDPEKPFKVMVRHRGYASVQRAVDFERGLDQRIEFKMVAARESREGAAGRDEVVYADSAATSGEAASAKAVPAKLATTPSVKPAATAPAATAPAKTTSTPVTPSGHALAVDDELAPVKVFADANESGYLVASTEPLAKVLIDGKDSGRSTPISRYSKLPLKPGKHVITFLPASGKRFNVEVDIHSGEETPIVKRLD